MDPRVEHSLIDKHVRQHNRSTKSEDVVWFEFMDLGTVGGSTYDDVYNEGGEGEASGRKYAPGIRIPTIYISENEDEYVAKDEGRQVLQNLRLTFLYDDVVLAGMTDPREYPAHLNDVFFYDFRYYKVSDYVVWGRLPGEVLIGVTGFEVYADQEFVFDTPPLAVPDDLPWPSTFSIPDGQPPETGTPDTEYESTLVGSGVSIGPTEPEDHSLIWIDTSDL